MKIAVIGSGFYGSSLAIVLSKKNDVDLYEKKSKIFNGASSCNQFRFHSGYHYPRSQKTVNEINKSKKDFLNFYSQDVFENTINYYSIAKKSKVNFKKYKNFLIKNKLFFKEVKLLKDVPTLEKSILVKEKILNVSKTKNFLIKKIKENKIRLFLNREFKKKDLINYDKVLIATYSNNNSVLSKLGVKDLIANKYQLVEKIVIKLPKKFKKKSFVVMDGDFVCVDPYLGTNYHLLSDVKLSKLETVISIFPKFVSNKKRFLNKGIIKDIKISKFKKFILNSSKYLPFLKQSKYVGSMFVVRALKKNKEKTDERVTSINNHNKKIISIFSGKWNNCVFLAKNLNL
jgi:D-amino-acid oxidase